MAHDAAISGAKAFGLVLALAGALLSADSAWAQFKGGAPTLAPPPSAAPRIAPPPPGQLSLPGKKSSGKATTQPSNKNIVKKKNSEPSLKKEAKRKKKTGPSSPEYEAAPGLRDDDDNAASANVIVVSAAAAVLPGLTIAGLATSPSAFAPSCGEFCGVVAITFPDEGGGFGPGDVPAMGGISSDLFALGIGAHSMGVLAPAALGPVGAGGVGGGGGGPPPGVASAANSSGGTSGSGAGLCSLASADWDDDGKGDGQIARAEPASSAKSLCFLGLVADEPLWATLRSAGAATFEVAAVQHFSGAVAVLPAPIGQELHGGTLVRLTALQVPPNAFSLAPSTVSVAGDEMRRDEIVVGFAPDATPADDQAVARDFDLLTLETRISRLTSRRLVLYRVLGNRTVADVLAGLRRDPRVTSAQPNYVFRGVGQLSAASAMPQYAPDSINLGAAHRLARGRQILVAVIDTAIDIRHAELARAIEQTFNAVDGTGEMAPAAHGTAVAGVVAANAKLLGVAPEARLLAIAAFAPDDTSTPHATTFYLVKGIDWANDNGARVINMSFAGPRDELLGEAIAALGALRKIVVAAAGNAGPAAKPVYPAAFPGVIAVSATDVEDRTYADANHGDYITLAAPGVDILTPGISQTYALQSGTSIAAAHVSGVAALILELAPSLGAEEVREILVRSARDPAGREAVATEIGAGIVDAAAALQRLAPGTSN